MTNEEFVKYIGRLATQDMKKTGILASITTAQAILESGYGTSELATKANNLFGMKASLSGNDWKSEWDGTTYAKETGEQKPNGECYTIIADFRKYGSIEAGIKDHSDYLAGAKKGGALRYEGIVGETDYTTAAKIIKSGGYATSLTYVDKLCDIIKRWDLTRFDKREGEEMGRKITLDAGHYGYYNQSPVNKAYYESRMNWKLHLLLKAALERYGFTVVTTRSNVETDLALAERGKAAAGSDFFISIHSNAAGNESVDYPVAYGFVNDTTTGIDEVSRDLGGLLAEVIQKTMNTRQAGQVQTRKSSYDRNRDGRLNDEYYGVLHGAKSVNVPGIILEHSFHTNTAATNWLLNDDNLAIMAEAEAAVIAKYFGMSGDGQATNPSTDTNTDLYRVRKTWDNPASQIGAYTILDNAKKACTEGYSVFGPDGEVVYTPTPQEAETNLDLPYKVRVDITDLRVRTGPGTNYGTNGYTGKGTFTITELADGKGANKWGRLKSGAGWIALDYAIKL